MEKTEGMEAAENMDIMENTDVTENTDTTGNTGKTENTDIAENTDVTETTDFIESAAPAEDTADAESGETPSKAGREPQLFDMPDSVKEPAERAFQALAAGDMDGVIVNCRQVLQKEPEFSAIRTMLAGVYYHTDRMWEAEEQYRILIKSHPEEKEAHVYMGLILYRKQNFQEALQEFRTAYPLDTYFPNYLTAYGATLYKLGMKRQALEIFKEEAAHYEATGEVRDAEVLDGVFNNLLILDAEQNSPDTAHDVSLYLDFLKKINFTEPIQEFLAGTIVGLSMKLTARWLQPIFSDFIDSIERELPVTSENLMNTLQSSHYSLESYQYNQDPSINGFLEAYFGVCHSEMFSAATEEDKYNAHLGRLSCHWYLCQYYPEHKEEFRYIREKYPYTWKMTKAIVERLDSEPVEKIEADIIAELLPYSSDKDPEKLRARLGEEYKKILNQQKVHPAVSQGKETLVREERKVMPNDPCPCGSGKKYKKCCGRKANA